MFGDIVEPSIKVGSKKWYTVPVSILLHTALIAAVIIIPLMAADVLPTPPSMMAFVAAPPAPPPPPPPPPPPAPPPPAPSATATRGGAGAQACHGREPGGRAGRSPARDQTRDRH